MRDRLAWRLRPIFTPQHYTVPLSYADQPLDKLIDAINQQISYPGEKPTATLTVSSNPESIEVFAGKQGREVDVTKTKNDILANISTDDQRIEAIVASTSTELSEEQVAEAIERAKLFVDQQLTYTFENRTFTVRDKELVGWLTLPEGYREDLINTKVATWAAQLNRPAQEPILEYDEKTLVVSKFEPPRDGLELDQQATHQSIINQLKEVEKKETTLTDEVESTKQESEGAELQLTVKATPPQQSLADTNDLGITERIGFGDSHYDHSIPNRIHNVSLTTERISDIIVAPGEEFSFNQALGEVSSRTGFRSAYVIKNGQTSLGDGGGVCQVSTTLFRSVLDAGLKVTKRLPHSYRVSYYELDSKPGVDATVYAGNVDLRFVNDTGHHILISGQADPNNLYMYLEIYGTSDGRTTEIVDHKTWNARPAPPPQYIPDPSLPEGQLRQVDWAAAGISASFVNVIKDKDGNVIREDTYTSHYRPWSAKYLQGVSQ